MHFFYITIEFLRQFESFKHIVDTNVLLQICKSSFLFREFIYTIQYSQVNLNFFLILKLCLLFVANEMTRKVFLNFQIFQTPKSSFNIFHREITGVQKLNTISYRITQEVELRYMYLWKKTEIFLFLLVASFILQFDIHDILMS